ncbi:hypothetical protein EDD16DRAFT_492060 [Pisolithus croceorrhizus]|nr:hypothetical protein EDD16DRAFT_492060 [Pisolithus croceorrhizus]KAI6168227.1 hypothetical protein EDD17DRAFT_755242 [Pisolithus thermaeus]
MSRTPSSASEDDTDSLFGSPPPCPSIGVKFSAIFNVVYSLQQLLETTTLAETEVGSIALPGTHMSCSGLPTHFPSPVSAIPDSSNREAGQLCGDRDTATAETLHALQHPPGRVMEKEKRKKKTTATVSTAVATPSRNDVIERARQRQRQLIAELECAKVELWETSIEGGVLVHLIRDQLKQAVRPESLA